MKDFMAVKTYPDGYIKSDIVLSIGLLVSNHIKYIEKCMEGLKPLLDGVNSELIILDTVGPEKSDGSIDVCRKYTDKIYRFEWINDFSAARNELIKHSRGEWFMYQDDDEWFENVDEFIAFFNSEDRYKYNSGFYMTKDYRVDGSFSMGMAGRMIRRRPDTKMIGRVHEHFNEADLPGKQFGCFTNHQGYVYINSDQRMAKARRNLNILDDEIEKEGTSPARCAQKVQELMNLSDRREEALSLSIQYADELVDRGFGGDSCVQWLIVFQVRYYHFHKDYEGTRRQAEIVRKKYRMSRYAMMIIAFLEAEAAMLYSDGQADSGLLKNDIERYVSIFDHFKTHPDEMLAETQLDFPQFFSEEKYQKMTAWLSQLQDLGKNSNLGTYADGFVKSETVLSIGILVSNHIEYIEKCMEGLKPLLDNLNSELIVIDTVGPEKSDGSIDICKKYTDKIYHFDWVNDFAAARNECIKHSKGEWFMFLDDDEWFDDVTELIEFFKHSDRYNYTCGLYYTRDYNANGSYSSSVVKRLVRRKPDTCFVGKVHEHFNDLPGPAKLFNVFVHHMGYYYETEEQRNAKIKRNLDILEKEMAEKGNNPERCAQMVQELLNVPGRRKEGYELSEKYAEELVEQGFENDSYVQWIIVSQVRYFHFLKDGENSVKQAAYVRGKYNLNKMAQLVLACVEAEAIVAFSGASKHLELLEHDVNTYLELYEFLDLHPDEKLYELQLDFPKFLTVETRCEMCAFGAMAMNYSGRYEEAYVYWKVAGDGFMANPGVYRTALAETLTKLLEKKKKA